MAKKISPVFKGDFPHTQGFGENPANYARFGIVGHNGDDYAMPEPTNILAPFNGKVLERGDDPNGYGRYLKVWDPSQNLQIILAHLSAIFNLAGQEINTGQLIAFSGNTGNSTGPHLHVAAGDTDGSGNRTNRGNGYDGWYSWLNLDRSGAPTTSGTTAPGTTPTTPPLVDEGGAPSYAVITAPRDREEFYGVVPTIQMAVSTAPRGGTVEYNIHISPSSGDGWRGWSTSRTWKPPITDFNNVNYSIEAAVRVKVDGVWRESPGTGGITIVVHPDVPPPSAREPEGQWVESSQAEYDSGAGGIYVRADNRVLKAINSVRENGNAVGFANGDTAEYAARGDYYGYTFATPDYGGFARKIDIGSEFTKGYHGASSTVVARQLPPTMPPPPPPPPPPVVPVPTGGDLESRVIVLEQKVAQLESGQIGQVTAPMGPNGLFYISSEPTRASIYIDGKFLSDYTPANMQYIITVGRHLITLKKKGYQEYNETVDVTQDMLYSKVINLVAV